MWFPVSLATVAGSTCSWPWVMALNFLLLLLFYFLPVLSGHSTQNGIIESVLDLQKSMYVILQGDPCVRLLNVSGEIGCSNPGNDKVVLPIIKFRNATELSFLCAVFVSLDDLQVIFNRMSQNVSFAKNIGGILIESGTELQTRLKGFSPAHKFPEAEFAPYHSNHYEWNSIGSGILGKVYGFPIILLSKNSTLYMQEILTKKDEKPNTYITNVVEFDFVMQTTKSGVHNSESCLNEGTCLPLGGYSVWSSLRPIDISSSDQSKPIILAMASMDSASFFRDKSLGAESPISGLISLLAAVDSLSNVDGLGDISKKLVFAVFTGESWGYLGSRRFLCELDLKSEAVNGLNSSAIEMVLEVGSVGNSFNLGNYTFFAHATAMSPNTKKAMEALKRAQNSLTSMDITLSAASASNPGIPPSSLMAFLGKNPLTSGIVMEDFDSSFTNKFYHSHLDEITNVNSSSMVAAASLLARTLYILAKEKEVLNSSDINSINVNASLVEDLMGCLLSCDPGLSCDLVKNYISPTTRCPNHYVGVVLGEPSSTPYFGSVNDVSRFIWNFLADKTSDLSSRSLRDCSSNDEVFIGTETAHGKTCVISTTRFVPAYSTRLKFESDRWIILPANSSDSVGLVDPVWTESNWDAIGFQVYAVQDPGFDHLVLVGAISLTVVSYLSMVVVREFVIKALKLD